jgi:hypothetical protein
MTHTCSLLDKKNSVDSALLSFVAIGNAGFSLRVRGYIARFAGRHDLASKNEKWGGFRSTMSQSLPI